MKHAVLMFLAILAVGMGMSGAWDLLTGRITEDITAHIAITVLLLGASVFLFMAYFKARNAQQRTRQ